MCDYKNGIKKGRSALRTCTKCGEPTGSTRTRCAGCTVPGGREHPNYGKYRQRALEHGREVWAAVLEHYGPRCTCCGETNRGFLTIDHIDGERGAEGSIKGVLLCAWIVRHGFPARFRVLCYNCNSSLGFRGYCPHGGLTQARHSGRPTTRVMSDAERAALRGRWERIKRAALEAYGGARCTCCGEDHVEFLTLDHVEDDGADQRRALTGKNLGGSANFYTWLRKEGYPPLTLEVTCMSCNAGRHRNGGICPHVGDEGAVC